MSQLTISRDTKYSAYKDGNYPVMLETKDSFMRPSQPEHVQEDRELCQRLLLDERAVPSGSLVEEERFESFCALLQSRSEAPVYLGLHIPFLCQNEQRANGAPNE